MKVLSGPPPDPPQKMNVRIVEIRAYLVGIGPISFPEAELVTWEPASPAGPALMTKGADGKLHQFIGCAFEVIMEESRIARPA